MKLYNILDIWSATNDLFFLVCVCACVCALCVCVCVSSVSGWRGLVSELEMDFKRLAKRNLGRDDRWGTAEFLCWLFLTCSMHDRCIADHQREGQFPFLDEAVVAFLQQLPMCHKVPPSLLRPSLPPSLICVFAFTDGYGSTKGCGGEEIAKGSCPRPGVYSCRSTAQESDPVWITNCEIVRFSDPPDQRASF